MNTVTTSKRKWIVLGAVALALAVGLSWFASPHPDGLERVAEDKGFLHAAKDNAIGAPVPDYAVGGVGSEWLATALAGVIGVLVMAAVLFGLRLLVKRP